MEKYILEAALTGLEAQKRTIETYINDVKITLGQDVKRVGRPRHTNTDLTEVLSKAKAAHQNKSQKRRVLSKDARERIANAQRKRWSAYRKSNNVQAPQQEMASADNSSQSEAMAS